MRPEIIGSFCVTVVLCWLAASPGGFADSAQFGLGAGALSVSILGLSYKLIQTKTRYPSLLANKYFPMVCFISIGFVAIASRAPQTGALIWSLDPFKKIDNETAECFSRASDPSSTSTPTTLGAIDVIECKKDKRGGYYFLTRESGAGLGPDQMSYGISYQPNSLGSPFGNAEYDTHHLFGDWYAFSASDDY